MSNSAERRLFPRRTFDEAIFVYEGGARLEAKPVDISLGGMFLAMAKPKSVERGTRIAVVFHRESGLDHAIYLFGRVVRRQESPSPGIALEWEKAVTAGEPTFLAAFVELLFGVRAEAVSRHVAAGSGQVRSMFSFDPIQRAAVRLRDAPRASRAAATAAPVDPMAPRRGDGSLIPAIPMEELRDLRVKRVPSTHANPGLSQGLLSVGGATEAGFGRHEPGSLTAEVAIHHERAALHHTAILRLSGATVDVTIHEMGTMSCLVSGAFDAPRPNATVELLFDIPTREGACPVSCVCRVDEVRARPFPGQVDLVLMLIEAEEGSTPGILSHFVKWAFQESLAGAGAPVD